MALNYEKINKIDKPLARLIKKNKRSYKRHHKNTKDHKRLLQATVYQ